MIGAVDVNLPRILGRYALFTLSFFCIGREERDAFVRLAREVVFPHYGVLAVFFQDSEQGVDLIPAHR